ncbi:hypothetical protein PLESTB_001723500 [Pleodorina starrii]|uniref:GATA-type domain-containing protein n=1 Tax=Pleodorina starrii TaxID=330485 RepID=A0A9W6BZH4_9CHLO|nr:hypothetical protein PLESTM_002009200 [Pleodorina starrii]GLC61149.1 hypothetical protein PLESTB_001723500 [Pleodorina starrii]GLC70111.1 hypothetical protein PLESTF_000925300 [Pleodorina starrii]
MSPAPANESATFLSPFFTTSTAAVPLSERDCNGAFACPAVSKAPTAAGSCAMRRGASFLDADDACLALSDKASFLIPEDSYLPGQENYAAAPCAPLALLPPLGRVHCPCPSASGACAAFPAAHATAIISSIAASARHRATTPFLLLDTPVFCGEEDFAAASVCFEKAEQALEMVERPIGLHRPVVAASDPHQQAAPTASDGGACDGQQAPLTDYEQQQTPDLHQPRRVSSLAPSPPASQVAGAGEQQLFPALPYEQAAAAAADKDFADAVESGTAVCWAAAAAAQEPVSAFPRAAALAAALAGPGPGMATFYMGQADDATAAATAAMDAAIPAAPAAAPVVKAFHHKTGGPCDHCGATESPQWRRGPPAKPMLCNACGTRFRRTNQLNPAAAITPAGRAAAAAASAPAAKRNAAAKRDPPYVASTSSKRGRSAAY